MNDERPSLAVHPVTAERWDDLERLFGKSGAYWGCWCMYWRMTNREFNASAPEARRGLLLNLIERGEPVGMLAYDGDHPVGWMSLAPRAQYHRLASPRTPYRPIDDQPVWSIVCFFIARRYRRQGVATALLRGGIEFARQRGVTLLEAYPHDPLLTAVNSISAYVGTIPMFAKAGFEEAARPRPERAIMRLKL
jgi:GNAT superfamily N-acetyltransferase